MIWTILAVILPFLIWRRARSPLIWFLVGGFGLLVLSALTRDHSGCVTQFQSFLHDEFGVTLTHAQGFDITNPVPTYLLVWYAFWCLFSRLFFRGAASARCEQEVGKRDIYQKLALSSWVIPLILVPLGHAITSSPLLSTNMPIVGLIVLAAPFLFATGVVCGLIGCCGVRKAHGGRSVVPRKYLAIVGHACILNSMMPPSSSAKDLGRGQIRATCGSEFGPLGSLRAVLPR